MPPGGGRFWLKVAANLVLHPYVSETAAILRLVRLRYVPYAFIPGLAELGYGMTLYHRDAIDAEVEWHCIKVRHQIK